MSKEFLKLSFSIIAVIIGIIGCAASWLLLPKEQSSALCLLILSALCLVSGILSTHFFKKRLDIIRKLQSNKLQHLARWHYTPCSYTFMREQIHTRYLTNCCTLILVAILLIILILSLPLTTTIMTLNGLVTLLLCVIGGTLLGLLSYTQYINKDLSRSHEVILSEHYIFFNNTLYSTHKGIYTLTDVSLLHREESYLAFTYGSPGTPYGPFVMAYIPIPSAYLEDAEMIQRVYTRWLDF